MGISNRGNCKAKSHSNPSLSVQEGLEILCDAAKVGRRGSQYTIDRSNIVDQPASLLSQLLLSRQLVKKNSYPPKSAGEVNSLVSDAESDIHELPPIRGKFSVQKSYNVNSSSNSTIDFSILKFNRFYRKMIYQLTRLYCLHHLTLVQKRKQNSNQFLKFKYHRLLNIQMK